MGIAFRFIRMEQTYIFSLGRFDFVRYQRHVLLVPSMTYMQTFVGSSSADLCLLVSCLRFIRSPLRTRCQFCVSFPDTKIALSFGYHAFVVVRCFLSKSILFSFRTEYLGLDSAHGHKGHPLRY